MSDLQPLSDDERAELIAFLDGELDSKESRKMEARLQRDPKVRTEAEMLRRTWELLDYLPRPEPSPTFTQRTVRSIAIPQTASSVNKSGRRWRFYVFGLSWAASLLVAVLLGYGGLSRWLTREPSNDDLARDLRLIENKRFYERVEDIDFLRQLDDHDLFGDENYPS